MKSHYAGSISFDNHREEWQDQLVIAVDYKEFIQDMKALKKRRHNSDVFFAVFKDRDGNETDITEQVRQDVDG